MRGPNTVPVPPKAPSTGKRIAIAGGGPGGLSAAYYLELMGHHAVVFEQKASGRNAALTEFPTTVSEGTAGRGY